MFVKLLSSSHRLFLFNGILLTIGLFWYYKSFIVISRKEAADEKVDEFEGTRILHSVPAPSSERCTIFRCANRTMENVQVFEHPAFYYVFLDESEAVRRRKVFPSWCRVPHLISLQKKGHKCVVYADDDVYLNLTRVENVIDALPKDVILVGTNNRHGRYYNINSGLIIFSNIQGSFTSSILKEWIRSLDNEYYHTIDGDKLRDQRALNDIMHCNMSNVFCYHENEKKRLGLVSHCFSCMNYKNPSGKLECMLRAKSLVTEWDAEGLEFYALAEVHGSRLFRNNGSSLHCANAKKKPIKEVSILKSG